VYNQACDLELGFLIFGIFNVYCVFLEETNDYNGGFCAGPGIAYLLVLFNI